MATIVPDHYRPGKKVGHVAVAHRAGAGNIISWASPNYEEPTPDFKRGKDPRTPTTASPAKPPVVLSVEGYGPGSSGLALDVSPLHGAAAAASGLGRRAEAGSGVGATAKR
jgi:hypothetical protein